MRSVFLCVFLFCWGLEGAGYGYDVGPDPSDEKIAELVDLMAEVPPLPEIGHSFGLPDFFRKEWGPVFLGFQGVGEDGTVWGRNALEVLVVGQDGVPLSDAAGRLGVSRFAGYSWSMARHFGYSRVGFVNAFPYGVDGQYSRGLVPVNYKTKGGKTVQIRVSFVQPELWYLGMDERGPLAPWRDRFYDWVLERNSDSLSLVILLGQAARDAFGGYLVRKGVEVPFRVAGAVLDSRNASDFVLSQAQLGGYRVEGLRYRGGVSLQGLRVGSQVLRRPVHVLSFPHHSQTARDAERDPKVLKRAWDYQTGKLKDSGWSGEPGSPFFRGEEYDHVRWEASQEDLSVFFDFGMPKNRYGLRGLASRRGYKPSFLVVGDKDFVLDEVALKSVREREVLWPVGWKYSLGRPVGPEGGVWERGPDPSWGKVFLSAGQANLFEEKPMGGYRLGVGPSVGLFGHYRGDLTTPRVVVLADPMGFDDMMTSRALTGLRGQHLQGLMEFLGFDEKYLVVKTVPSAMEGVSTEDWEWVLERLRGYHQRVVLEVSSKFGGVIWAADGPWAKRVLEDLGVPYLEVPRTGDFSEDMRGAVRRFSSKMGLVCDGGGSVEPKAIPRSHLPFFSRSWEGAAGDSVFAESSNVGDRTFFFVVPDRMLKHSEERLGEWWWLRYQDLVGEGEERVVDEKQKTPTQ